MIKCNSKTIFKMTICNMLTFDVMAVFEQMHKNKEMSKF